MIGQPIQANSPLLIMHCATSSNLASDLIDYRNDFGTEFEVNVHNYSTKNKSQNLALENKGTLSAGIPTKFSCDENIWCVSTAPDPSFDYELEGAVQTFESLLQCIKSKILERGNYGIWGLAWTFWIMDNNGNGTLSADEFKTSLLEYGISLTWEQSEEILRKFDKNKDGVVNFNEFLRYLRGDINPFRQGLILQAYKKLDVNWDGLVKLDDIAKIYDASKHPDVLSGKLSTEEVYMEFMSMWDT